MAVKRATRNAPAKLGEAHKGKYALHVGNESESEQWSRVYESARRLAQLGELAKRYGDGTIGREVVTHATNIQEWASRMFKQVTKGVHRNSPLTVFSLANPPKGAKLMSDHLYTIEYKHKQNGKNYFHDFKPGTQMHALPDGSVRISRPGAKVWGDFPAE